jgi:hypothetical protein
LKFRHVGDNPVDAVPARRVLSCAPSPGTSRTKRLEITVCSRIGGCAGAILAYNPVLPALELPIIWNLKGSEHIRNGKIYEIEAMGYMAKHGVKNGWEQ